MGCGLADNANAHPAVPDNADAPAQLCAAGPNGAEDHDQTEPARMDGDTPGRRLVGKQYCQFLSGGWYTC